MPHESNHKPGASTPVEQAKALAVILREEFGIAFEFFDAGSGAKVFPVDGAGGIVTALEPASVRELAADGRAHVSRLPSGGFQLSLLLYAKQEPVLVAAGVVAALDANNKSAAVALEEQNRLQRWLQAVSDRLRLGDQLLTRRRGDENQASQSTVAWEALLALDQLTRRLRVHKDPAKNRQYILEAAFGLVRAQTMVWVPAQSSHSVMMQGEPCLTHDQCRQLCATLAQSPELQAPAPMLCNQVQTSHWGSRFPSVDNVMAFLVTDQGPLGWFLVLNKQGGPFRRSDAALLLPTVALLELYQRWLHRYQDLKDLLVGLTRSLTTALDAKDTYTYGHSERVARIAIELGRELGLEGDELGDVYLAGLLHDVGKIGIKDTVLHKPGPLTAEEQDHIQQHVTIGYWILAELRQIRNLLPGVLYHHERFDGKGYPDGLVGENIPLLARILAVADAYDAMSHQRPYRDSMPYRRVEEILLEGAGSQWDKKVVEAFLRCRQRIHTIRQRGVGDSLRQAIDGALRSDTDSARSQSLRQPRSGLLPGASPLPKKK